MASVFNRGSRDRPLWYAKFRDADGRWKMRPTHQPTKVLARRFAEQVESRIANGKVGIEAPQGEMTLGALADYWLENHSAAACSSHRDNVSRMKHLRDAFGPRVLSQITPQAIDEFKAAKIRGGKQRPATVNRMLALLRKMLNDAVRWGYLAANPMHRVRTLPVAEQDFTFLHLSKAQSFLSWTRENAPADFALYAAAIYTGMRMGELYGLEWGDVDLDSGTVTVRRSYDRPYTKSKRIRRVPINRQLGGILREWQRRCPSDALVFPSSSGGRRPREKPPIDFGAHLKGAECPVVRFHDLRHTAASLMVMAGITLRAVQQTLGHSTIQVTERYAHLAPEFMAAEADRLSLDLDRGNVIPLPVREVAAVG